MNNISVLVDTSVWINFFKDINTDASAFLTNNITEIDIVTCPVIIQEVLQGVVTDTDELIVKTHFSKLIRLIEDPYILAIDAAKLYRNLRKKGITIRKPNDCLIAVYAIKNDISLLHDDKDFTNIAAFSDLKTVQV